MGGNGKLQKAKIEFYEVQLKNGKETEKKAQNSKDIEVPLNPNNIRITEGVDYSVKGKSIQYEKGKKIKTSPVAQFCGHSPRTLSVQLVFDTYTSQKAQKKDVRTQVRQLEKVIHINSNMGRPPKVKFRWSSIVFEGYVTNFNYEYTLFEMKGKPVRAFVDLSITDYDIS